MRKVVPATAVLAAVALLFCSACVPHVGPSSLSVVQYTYPLCVRNSQGTCLTFMVSARVATASPIGEPQFFASVSLQDLPPSVQSRGDWGELSADEIERLRGFVEKLLRRRAVGQDGQPPLLQLDVQPLRQLPQGPPAVK